MDIRKGFKFLKNLCSCFVVTVLSYAQHSFIPADMRQVGWNDIRTLGAFSLIIININNNKKLFFWGLHAHFIHVAMGGRVEKQEV